MKKFAYFLFLGWFVQVSFAQSPTLIARYPLKADKNDAVNQNLPVKMLGTKFEEGGARCQGIYDDFDAGKGVGIFSPTIEALDLDNFSVRVDFKVASMQRMPVFAVDRWYRHFVFGLTAEGKIILGANNNDLKKESTLTYKTNTWQTATIVVQKGGTVIAYLDKTEVARLTGIKIDKGGTGKDISTVNFSNGACFDGWWRDLRVYNGTWTTNTPDTNPIDKPIDNPIDKPVDNPVTITALGTWKSLDFNVIGKPSTARFQDERQFFPLKNKAGNLEVVWQDQDNKKVYVSRFGANLQASQILTLILPTPANTKLMAVANDENDNYYYMVAESRGDRYKKKQNENDIITLCKADKSGKQVAQKAQNSAQDKLDIWAIGEYPSVLKYRDSKLLLFTARTMNKSSDGLNHQGGIAVSFDANTLDVVQDFGQTSGHSFDNFLTINQNGEFIGMDLGDNYPRGINMHRFTATNLLSRKLVYTFKTQHGATPQSPAGQTYPKYEEISTVKQNFYKWSNDNGVYTELGGIVEVNDGYFVIFAGEPDANGKSINNARTSGYQNMDSRNIGYVKVNKDLNTIISKGTSETGGFYTFGGNWSNQKNEGIVWLTKHKNPKTENAQHIKTIALPNGNVLILYAVNELASWQNTTEFYQPYMMCIDAQGKVVLPATAIDKNIKLNRRDEIMMVGKQIILVEGINEGGNKIRLHTLELK